jgi:hypothetical protein
MNPHSTSFPRASEIRSRAKGSGYVEDYIRDILALIKDDIYSASERRATEAVTPLPTDFNIPTMNSAEAQRMIYYYVAKKLESFGYIPTYSWSGRNTENQKWWLRTRWLTENDTNARIYMDSYIKSRTEYTDPHVEERVSTGRRRAKKGTRDRVRKDRNVIVNRDNKDLQDIIILN